MLNDLKIVLDSSADLKALDGADISVAPLKIITANREFIDNDELDVGEMSDFLKGYSGKSSTACPSPGDWISNFDDKKFVFCITITSGLSGSYNSACIAKSDYEQLYPGRRVYVVDTLSVGGEMQLMAEKILELAKEGMEFDDIATAIEEYKKHTGLLFMLESMRNLANNGRVNPIVAKAVGLLGIRIVGKASDKGELEVLEKCRGEKKTLSEIASLMIKMGYSGGKVRLGHSDNDSAAAELKKQIESAFPKADIKTYSCRGLCTFYAEKGGMILGFER